jgi:hypothetical protein
MGPLFYSCAVGSEEPHSRDVADPAVCDQAGVAWPADHCQRCSAAIRD